MADESAPGRPQRILDFRIPLWSAGVMLFTYVFASGGMYVKMQEVQSTLTSLEVKADRRDTADEEMSRQIDRMSSRFDVYDMRITRNAQDISDLKSSVHDLNTAVTVGKVQEK
ncbi:hypothetical protein [Gluconobacter sp. Gdi]|uniref:hypothetical protein n=1 Tax=Gluconobacter sp. Gdi TaxID=2691888 RepID=UPI00176840F8|nr:hypothetical protein [Gluconobacter sp. Gdi]GFE96597.1 hypothetical protein DmGdi_16700 [Gluconobacter sp. Gdi]